MKIVFLDIDGVLNSRRYDAVRREFDENIDESRLPLLKQILDQTDAKVVLTSSWRIHWDPNGKDTDEVGKRLAETFLRAGIALYDKTSEINNDRAEEIASWLASHPNVESYVILDDIKFGWKELEDRVIKTDYRIGRGLESRHVEKAIELLLKTE